MAVITSVSPAGTVAVVVLRCSTPGVDQANSVAMGLLSSEHFDDQSTD